MRLDLSSTWDFQRLTNVVFDELVQCQISILLPLPTTGNDILSWNATHDGIFTMKGAYYLIEENPGQLYNLGSQANMEMERCEKIRVFMQVAFNNRLPINEWGSKWSSTSPLCHYCNTNNEDVLHIFRDCKYARQLWLSLLNPNNIFQFFTVQLCDWMVLNLKNKIGQEMDSDWVLVWGVFTWKLWTWRNQFAFENNFQKPVNQQLISSTVG